MPYQVITTEKTPIKMWLPVDLNEEDAPVLDQFKNLANHPLTFKHVCGMPDFHLGYGMPIGGVLATKGGVIPNAVGVDIGCFVGDTLIPLLDGTQKSLKELTYQGDTFWVYSINKNGRVVPGRACAKKTRKDASLVEVVISSGARITCTPDHQFLLRDGTYREARDLKFNDSLMPLYRTYQTRDGYEHILHPEGKNEQTHKMVSRYFGIEGEVIHHQDMNHFNNTPENLKGMSSSAQVIHNNTTSRICELCSTECKNLSTYRRHMKKEHNDHKVVCVKPLEERADVYCLHVENYHNFALAAGVFVHNCGMLAVETQLYSDDISRDQLQDLRKFIHTLVPVGLPPAGEHKTPRSLPDKLTDNAPKIISGVLEKAAKQLGTLGSGNHFIEIQKDVETSKVWIMLHSGSRKAGMTVCDHYHKYALKQMKLWRTSIPDYDLSFIPEHTQEFYDYLEEMRWSMAFAEENRELMLNAVYQSFDDVLGVTISEIQKVDTHHNYAEREHHFGENVLVHRKGAVKAEGLVTIPGSMGTASYIAEGLRPTESFNTCSHGAGRVLSRRKAKETITHEQAIRSMSNVVFGVRQGDYDEMPDAYKDIDAVINAQLDLVRPVHKLVPLAVVKG